MKVNPIPEGCHAITPYLTVPDAAYKRAIEAGATSVMEPANMFYGDRHACVKDVAENDWSIATHIEDLTLAEIQERAAAFFREKSKHAAS